MTNREKYKDEILDLLRKGDSVDAAIFYDTYIATKYDVSTCADSSVMECMLSVALWLNEEYEEPKVDWSKVEIDTPVLVRNNPNSEWDKRHFAKYENGKIFTWVYGATSWSCSGGDILEWNYAKLATENASEEILIKL